LKDLSDKPASLIEGAFLTGLSSGFKIIQLTPFIGETIVFNQWGDSKYYAKCVKE